MPPHQWKGAAPKSGPHGTFLAGSASHSAQQRFRQGRSTARPPATTAITEALTGALTGLDASDQTQLLDWTAGRAFLALAHEQGFAAAAAVAYRFADQLAGGAR